MPILKSASIAESNCFGGPRINHVTLSFLQHNYSKRRFGEGQYEQVLTVQEDLGNVWNRAQLTLPSSTTSGTFKVQFIHLIATQIYRRHTKSFSVVPTGI